METKAEKKNRLGCPARLTVLVLSLLWLGFYFLFRGDRALMNALCDALVRPWHRFAGRAYDVLPFSAAELYIGLGVLAALCFLAQLVVHFARRPGDWRRLGRWAVTLLALLAALFGLFCLWWGVYYYADSFSERSGLQAEPVSAQALEAVTDWFVERVNATAPLVARDENGAYAGDEKTVFAHSSALYGAAAEIFPCLDGPALRAKPVAASVIMSYVNYTGFFFPYTAEANLNVDSPRCLLPATIAHELAHQRGVAAEDEANFAAVLACLSDGDADYAYSGSLMAYIYLGNALHDADYGAWREAYSALCAEARRDLADNNAYWARFETPVKEASETVYETFLQTYGDDRGMQSYGACVDLLVAYYYGQTQG